jgi:hypothetical protein
MPSRRASTGNPLATASDPEPVTQVLDPDVWRRWRSGPRWYYALAAVITDSRVEQRRVEVAAALSEWLDPAGASRAHVTVRTLGFAPVEWQPRWVNLTVAEPETFAAAAYLAVDAPQILELRKSWEATAPAQHDWPPEDRTSPYRPHVTVGTYSQVVPLTEIRERLAQLDPHPALQVPAQIQQIAVDTRSPTGEWKIA